MCVYTRVCVYTYKIGRVGVKAGNKKTSDRIEESSWGMTSYHDQVHGKCISVAF